MPSPTAPSSVVVTGAAGRIGSGFAAFASSHLDLRLTDRAGSGVEKLRRYGDVSAGDLADRDHLTRVCSGAARVLHLAADPRPGAAWESVLPNNVEGTYNVFEAASAAGCERVVFASSINAVNGYPPERLVSTRDAPNPGNLYGASKAFGEALARLYSNEGRVRAIAVRIGAFQSLDDARAHADPAHAGIYVSPRDTFEILLRCLVADVPPFAVVHAVSRNAAPRLDMSDTTALLGYEPVDDFSAIRPRT